MLAVFNSETLRYSTYQAKPPPRSLDVEAEPTHAFAVPFHYGLAHLCAVSVIVDVAAVLQKAIVSCFFGFRTCATPRRSTALISLSHRNAVDVMSHGLMP